MIRAKRKIIIIITAVFLLVGPGISNTQALPTDWWVGIFFSQEGYSESTGIYQAEYSSMGIFLDPFQFKLFSPSFYFGLKAPLFPPNPDNACLKYSIYFSIYNFKNHFLKSAMYLENWINPAISIEGLYYKRKGNYYIVSVEPLRLRRVDGYVSFFSMGIVYNHSLKNIGWNIKLFETALYLF